MRQELRFDLLLGIAVAIIIVMDEGQVDCGVVLVHSSSSSSSSGFETYCNGLRCPGGSNCMAFTNIINGNKTSDKRCTNNYGKVIRQETITVANGERCIKNLTMVGKKANVERSCSKLSKAELEKMEREEKNRKIQEAVQDALEREQDALEEALDREEQYMEDWRGKMERKNEQRIDALDSAKDHRDLLDDIQKNLYESEVESKHEAWERQAEALEERLEREAEAREELMERQQEELERASDARQDRIDTTLKALTLATKARTRWGFRK